jgi:hypothetical protein
VGVYGSPYRDKKVVGDALCVFRAATGNSLGIIFVVVDSDRFDEVLENNKDIINVIAPKWEKTGEGWNTVFLPLDRLESANKYYLSYGNGYKFRVVNGI